MQRQGRSANGAALCALGLILPLLAACPPGAAEDAKASEASGRQEAVEAAPILVRTTKVVTADLARFLRATATLESERRASLSLVASGIVTTVTGEVGQEVHLGDEMVVLDRDQLQAALDEAALAAVEAKQRASEAALVVKETEATLATVKLGRQEAANGLARQEKLFTKSLVSEGEVDAARFADQRSVIAVTSARLALTKTKLLAEIASTAVQRAERARDRAALGVQNAVLKAPFTGVIATRSVRKGEHVAAGQALFEIADPTRLRAPVYLPQKNLGLLRKDLAIRIQTSARPGLVGHGRVLQLPRTVDPATGNIRLEVELDDPEGFIPGMFVTLRIVTEQRTGVPVIPKKAMRRDGHDAVVYRVRDGVCEEIRFTPGLEEADHVEVTGGALAPGDRVVLIGVEQVEAGTKVSEAGRDQPKASWSDSAEDDETEASDDGASSEADDDA